jgi:[ribosomal protein S5]-alanine N-acetyltransferase
MKLQYKTYYLKEFTVDDINKEYIEWLNNPEINRYLEAKYTVWNHLNATKYVQSFRNNKEKYLFGIYTLEDDKYIGNGSISSVNYNTEVFEFALFVGDKTYWGKKVAFEVTLLLLRFGFDDLKLRKVFGGAYSNQIASRFTLKKIGFTQEAILKDRYIFEGEPIDCVIHSLDRSAWEQVNEKYFSQ